MYDASYEMDPFDIDTPVDTYRLLPLSSYLDQVGM
jgi:hypothetical protein